MGKLTRKYASTIADNKPHVKVAHVPGVSLGRTHSNPINIMKNAERRSTRAMESSTPRPCLSGDLLRNSGEASQGAGAERGPQRPKGFNDLLLRDASDGRSSK
jgi:hypothetical protein